MKVQESPQNIPEFGRRFFDAEKRLTTIGAGSLGGKAQGLAFIHEALAVQFNHTRFPYIEVNIPTFTVIRTNVFDAFMERDDLIDIANSNEPDDRIAHVFQKADLPVELLGDLRALVQQVRQPLAVRSSSLLEDALREPFAGIYETKMTPNNQPDPDVRFRKLTEAIKFIYGSTFFKAAKDYRKATGHSAGDEKMAVIIQEVVGHRHGERFYPEISGVARSYNFYPLRPAKPEEGVVSLALGLGKTIVDGGVCWTYSPAQQRAVPPFGSVSDWLKGTQTDFWAVNMGKPPAFDPIRETEYLIKLNLSDAEYDGTLRHLASTYDPRSDRIVMGTGAAGPRVLTFAPLLVLNDIPLNDVIRDLLKLCEDALKAPVEIEFAVTFPRGGSVSDNPARFGLLQVRPMVVSHEVVEIADDEMDGEDVLLASEAVLGNGIINSICDVVYVKPETFEAKNTPLIAAEFETINCNLMEAGRSYLLIGFGRWGSSDPWLGIPVNWGQVSGARVIVEATQPNMDKEISQGSHFFHNLVSFQVSYFAVRHSGNFRIDWAWLDDQPTAAESSFVRHVNLTRPLLVKVDGRSGRGVVKK